MDLAGARTFRNSSYGAYVEPNMSSVGIDLQAELIERIATKHMMGASLHSMYLILQIEKNTIHKATAHIVLADYLLSQSSVNIFPFWTNVITNVSKLQLRPVYITVRTAF
jgi:hypothetical protein